MNKLFTKIAALALGAAMAFGVGVSVSGQAKVSEVSASDLTFSLTSNPGGWPTANNTSLTSYTYTKDNVDYTFGLKNCKCNSGYLMCTQVAVIGLPAISGQKLTKVVAQNSSGCSTSVRVGVSSSDSSASYISGGAYQTWSTQSSSYTYNLTDTEVNTVYYLYVTNKNAQITGLTLTYESSGSTQTVTAVATPVAGSSFVKSYSDVTSTTTWNETGLSAAVTTSDGNPYSGTTSYTFVPATPLDYVKNGSTSLSITATAGGITSSALVINDMSVSPKTGYAPSVAYTVAQARAAIDAGTDKTGVYATGIVSAIPTPYNSGYGNITFNMVDAKGDTVFLQAYRCSGTDAENVQIGDIAVVSGNLTKYSSTYEFEQGCTLVSLTHPVEPSVSFAKNYGRVLVGETKTYEAITANLGSSSVGYSSSVTAKATVNASSGAVTGVALGSTVITALATVDNEDYSDQYTLEVVEPSDITTAKAFVDAGQNLEDYYVEGYISQVGSYEQSKYLTYYISDDGSTNDEFEIYRGLGLNGASFSGTSDLSVGDHVVVYGTVKKYNSTYEFNTGSVLISKESQTTYEISVSVTNGTYSGDSTIGRLPSSEASVTITPSAGYKLPSSVTVTGASHTFSNGVISLSNPTGNVSITVVCATATNYTITVTESGCTHTGDTSIYEQSAATLTFTANSGYNLPSSVTISGATQQSWNSSTGVLVIENPTGNVSITVTATEQGAHKNSTNLNPGDYYIAYNDSGTKHYISSISGGKGATNTTKSNGIVFTFSLVGDDAWEITNGDNYLSVGTSSTSLSLSSTQTSLGITWENETNGTRKITGSSGRELCWYADNSDIRTYSGKTDGTNGMTLESSKEVVSFTVDDSNANKNVLKGSTFNATAAANAGFIAKLNYSDSTSDDVTALATWTLDTSTSGTATLTVTYSSYTPVSINDMTIYSAVMTSLTIDASSAKTTGYWVGDTLNTDNLVITGHDASANEYSIAISDVTFTPTTLNVAGNSVTITVTYTNDSGSSPETASGSYTVSVTEFAYEVATSINGGDKIIFATDSEHSSYMSSINSKNYGDVTEYTDKPGTEHTYTVVAGSQDGTVAFKNSSGQYLNGSTAKALSLTSTISDATSWTVSFNDEVPTITNVSTTTNVLKYNASSPRIAAYANTNSIFLNIYKLKGTSGQSAAEGFADLFNELVVDEVCAVNDSSFDEQMPTAWELIASDYDDISAEAKAYIASKSANASGDDVEKMLYEYKHIYETYGSTLSLSNFLGRTEVTKAALVKLPNTQLLGEANATTIIIIVSVIGVSALGGFFFLRKRKEI